MKKLFFALSSLVLIFACNPEKKQILEPPTVNSAKDTVAPSELKKPFYWESANVYFLLTDRFNNGKKENDINFNRTDSTGVLRGFMGGDIAGIIHKIEQGYFTNLGINAIWFTPVVEQIHGATDEGTGNTYGYHGYWAKDWTSLDPNFGTTRELERLVKTAHENGIRILMDVVLNHTGPVTDQDPIWPEKWVRRGPTCEFNSYENTTVCNLVANLPDIKTESDETVELPDALLAKWKEDGRLRNELEELQLFFDRTGYPRTPRFYVIKWLSDYVNDLGIDGFRVDTAKHVNENAWSELYREASYAFDNWKKKHPQEVLDDTPFFMVGEVYGYGISRGRSFDFGDKKVDYFSNGFKSLINFELKNDALHDYETIFKKYSNLLHNQLSGKSILNYLTSHDDMSPFDPDRKKSRYAANVLLLTPGASQVYYGDETDRNLVIEGAVGDATLRSFMNWGDLDSVPKVRQTLEHWQKLGKFRRDHPAIGTGIHAKLSSAPYVFSRTFTDGGFRDKVVVGLDLPKGKKSLWVKGFFGDGTVLFDAYSGTLAEVANGRVQLDNDHDIALLELAK